MQALPVSCFVTLLINFYILHFRMKTSAQRLEEGSKFQYIDCLRGIAILLVIINHADWHLPEMNRFWQLFSNYGQMGVQLFFVASAYTLCLSMDRRKNDENLKTFYVRRYFRIAPLYYLGIPLYLIYHSFIEPVMDGEAVGIADWYTLPNILANVLLINDFVPGGANTKVVPGGWSIGTETTFYAIFPFVFLLYNQIRNSNAALFLFPFIGLALSFAGIFILELLAVEVAGYKNFYYFKENDFLYFNLLCQLPVFLMGMSLYFKATDLQAKPIEKYFLFFAFIGFTIIGLFTQVYFQHVISIQPFVPAISFFFLFLLFKEVPWLSNKLLARIGQLSYSIYLFHFIFAFEGSRFLYNYLHPYLTTEIIFLLTVLLTIIFSMGIAVVSEKYIEKPGIDMGRRIINKIKSKEGRKKQLATLKTESISNSA